MIDPYGTRRPASADLSVSRYLHLLVDGNDGRLNGDRIRAAVPEWQSASFWFCGPPGFGQALREDLIAHGLAPERFHQELFQMR